jgi:O-antigen ligase
LHNQYIYSAAAYGLWGLASWLLYVGGLVALFVKLKHTHTPVAWGFLGVACMLMLQGLTNVNLAHNHYGVMVSMAVCLLFVVAKTSGNTARGAGKPEGFPADAEMSEVKSRMQW